MPFQIMYKFEEDQELYTCKVTHDQFKNFKKLPIVKECEIIKKDQKNIIHLVRGYTSLGVSTS